MDEGYHDIIEHLRLNGHDEMADRFERLVKQQMHDRARQHYEAMLAEVRG